MKIWQQPRKPKKFTVTRTHMQKFRAWRAKEEAKFFDDKESMEREYDDAVEDECRRKVGDTLRRLEMESAERIKAAEADLRREFDQAHKKRLQEMKHKFAEDIKEYKNKANFAVEHARQLVKLEQETWVRGKTQEYMRRLEEIQKAADANADKLVDLLRQARMIIAKTPTVNGEVFIRLLSEEGI